MSNLDNAPDEQTCASRPGPGTTLEILEILVARQVPLGGARAMTVRRTLPQRSRSMVGAWCFLDHFGPDDVTAGPGMQVPPHPHTGLQTVTWLFAGEIEHHDSVGSACLVSPGELNLMTAGRGISHSEHSPDDRTTTTLHGVQLWTALPHAHADVAPAFEHHEDLPVLTTDGARVQVFLGALPAQPALGADDPLVSPATTYSEIVGAQIDLVAGTTLTLEVDPEHEHALLLDSGESVTVDGEPLAADQLGYLAPGRRSVTLAVGAVGETGATGATSTTGATGSVGSAGSTGTAGTTSETSAMAAGARLVLLGGRPSTEPVVMWWNFVGRSHEDVVTARADWQRQNLSTGQVSPSTDDAPAARFGTVVGYDGAPLPAPVLPNVRLAPRRNPS